MYKPWEKTFTVVQWDQRGAGHTFGRYGTNTPDVTLDRISKDGVELAEYLCRRLSKKKIIILGHSWGSLVATRMVQMRPDLFGAYVGTGQVASWMTLVNTQYDLLLAKARTDGNQATVKELETIGRPGIDKGDHRHPRLLCADGERPRRNRPADKTDQLAPSHGRPQGSGTGHRTGSN